MRWAGRWRGAASHTRHARRHFCTVSRRGRHNRGPLSALPLSTLPGVAAPRELAFCIYVLVLSSMCLYVGLE